MGGKTLISVVLCSQRRWRYGSSDSQAHSEDAECSVLLRIIPSTPATDPFISVIHAIRNMDSRSAPAEIPPSESAKISFIQLSVFSSPIFRKSMTALVVFQKKNYYIVRMVDSPMEEERLDMKRGMNTPLYFYQVQDYQPRKKHEVEL
jgi:hypothetical protein